ncbi:MAG: glycerol-3-phosphate 1-O-acyltransferase PlsY [bacterium]|nr:glycerol-3-phosphate 1-O-acyltransferase PlsY [bacterium]
MSLALLAVAAFLLGAVPFPFLIARLRAGIDIRDHGSGNPGASNVFRVVGAPAGIITFVLDCAKAVVAVKLSVWFLPVDYLDMEQLIWFKIGLGILAVLGHVFSPFLGGRGGKGVATVIGVFYILFPLGLLTGALCGLAVIIVYRFFSLGSLVGVCALPVAYFLLHEQPWHPASLPILYLSLLAMALVLVRHTDNIKRLISGREHGMVQT